MKMTIEEAMAHAGELNPGRIEERALEAIPHYMWLWGRGKAKKGICTNCLHVAEDLDELESLQGGSGVADPYVDDMLADPFVHPGWYKKPDFGFIGVAKHGNAGFCPRCGALVTYRDLARGHRALRDRIFLIDWRKSAVDANAVCMVGYEVEADWRGPLHEEMAIHDFCPQLRIEAREICIFIYGQGGARFVKDFCWETDYDAVTGRAVGFRRAGDAWRQRTKMNSLFTPGMHVPFLRHRWDTEVALAGTSFGRVMEQYDYEANCDDISLIPWMREIARYPSLEYLGKLGMESLGLGVLNGRIKGLLNLRGKTPARVLKIPAECWGFLKGRGYTPDAGFLESVHCLERWHVRIGWEKIWKFSRLHTAQMLKEISSQLGDAGLIRKSVQYLVKTGISGRDFLDHARMLQEEGGEWQDPSMLFPRNFEEVHRTLAMRKKYLADRKQQAKLEKQLERLDGYQFSALGLVLCPIPTIEDVIREGSVLKHCVGTYCARYAEGWTILCTLREEFALDMPLYTVEFSPEGRMIQCRGYQNKTRPGDEDKLALFWKLFTMTRLAREQQDKRRSPAA